MNGAIAFQNAGDWSAGLKRLAWRNPQWWCICISAIASLAMLGHGWQHWGHSHHHWMSFPEELLNWLTMIAAMMLPLLMEPIRESAFRSLWGRRHRAIAMFLAGYFLPWLGVGVAVASIRQLSFAHTHWLAAAMFFLAGLWVLASLRRRALAGCHLTVPLPIEGWRADLGCLRFGGLIGKDCAIACGPLMFACALTGHDLVAMIGGGFLGAFERFSFRPRSRAVMVGAFVLGGFYLLRAASLAN